MDHFFDLEVLRDIVVHWRVTLLTLLSVLAAITLTNLSASFTWPYACALVAAGFAAGLYWDRCAR